MFFRIGILTAALALGGCTGEQLSRGIGGFVVGATVDGVVAAVTGEEVVPAAVDGGFEGAVEAAYPEEEETDLKVILTEDNW